MDNPLTLTEHLNEIRKRLIISLISLLVSSTLTFSFSAQLLAILKFPAIGVIEKLAFFSPQEPFSIYMRLAFFSGFVISLPIILYQAWIFISPAIEAKFKKYIVYFVVSSFTAFITGGVFAYFVLIPQALKFLLSFAKDGLEPVISAEKYISFVIGLILGCGLVFQMPILSFILSKFGMINSRFLRGKYKYAVVVIFIAAAIITPTPDAFNMFLFAVPMLFLYEVSIWVSALAYRKPNPAYR